MNKQKREAIFKRFAANDPNPTTELQYSSIFELVIAVMLSAQATDKSVNKATATLFTVAKTPQQMLALGETELKKHIQSINLYPTKAKHIIRTCQLLVEKHQGKVPHTRQDLEALPGIGRKTANVILNTAFDEPTIAVDTHIFRVANRTHLAQATTRLAVEKKLNKLIPKPYLKNAHHWLVLHGRYICQARRPKCPLCPINDLCEYKDKTGEIK